MFLPAGAEPPNLRLLVVAPAPAQLPNRPGGQAGQAPPAAQHAVGHDVPRRDTGGAGSWRADMAQRVDHYLVCRMNDFSLWLMIAVDS